MKAAHVVVVGAGPAGLALALVLRKSGTEVTLVERHPRERIVADAGGAYELNRTTLGIFEELSVLDEVRRRGIALSHFELRSGTGRILQRLDLEAAGFTMLSITRAELQRALLARLEGSDVALVDGSPVDSILESNERAVVVLASGRRIDADLVVGADGVHSRVRRSQFLDEPPIDVGIEAYWGRTRTSDVGFDLAAGRSLGWLVPGRSLVVTRGRGESDGEWLWTLCATAAPGAITVGAAASTLPDEARTLVERAARVSATRLYEQRPLRRWTSANARTLLIGDAAHGMTPFLGLGANSAIEDAHRFGTLLGSDRFDERALRDLARVRLDALNPRIAEARRLGRMMHSPNRLAHALFRAITWVTPSAVVLHTLAKSHATRGVAAAIPSGVG